LCFQGIKLNNIMGNILKQFCFLLIVISILSGCATTTQYVPIPTSHLDNQSAIIVLKRLGAFRGAGRTVSVYDNEEKIGKLASNGVLQWMRKKGTLKLDIKQDGKTYNSLIMDIKNNEVYNLTYDYSTGQVKLQGAEQSSIKITSNPSGALIYSGTTKELLKSTSFTTPHTWTLPSGVNKWRAEFYKVTLPRYEDSPIIFKNNSLGNRNVHFDLIPVINNSSKSYSKITKTTNQLSKDIKKIVPSVPSYGSDDIQKWAAIIGISKYQHAGKSALNNLIFADDDAKAFARSLRNLGWSESHMKVLINKDATQRNIMIALESWLTKAGPNDQIILFWAGHGFPDPEDPEKVYFACYDTDISIPATGYRMDNVRRSLEEKKARNVVLLADTCHAGKLITRSNGNRGISIVPNIKRRNVPKGWVFMVGADTDRQAIEHSSWSNGAFTHSLIKGLNGEADGFQSAGAKDGIVTMGELKDYMNISMPDETQRVLGVAKRPVIMTSTGDPDIWNLTLQVK